MKHWDKARQAAWHAFGHRWWRWIVAWDLLRRYGVILVPAAIATAIAGGYVLHAAYVTGARLNHPSPLPTAETTPEAPSRLAANVTAIHWPAPTPATAAWITTAVAIMLAVWLAVRWWIVDCPRRSTTGAVLAASAAVVALVWWWAS